MIGRMTRTLFLCALGAAAALGAVQPAQACTVTSTLAPNLGTYSPAAIKQGVVPVFQMRAGLICTPSTLVLLGSTNFVRAKFHSLNNFNLKNGGNLISYVASADTAGAYRFKQDQTLDYMQNNLLDLLGLLNTTTADMPLVIKASSTNLVPIGLYTDQIVIDWTWNMCGGAMVLGYCTPGPAVSGSGKTTIDISMTVTPKTITLTTTTSTTWDPVNNAAYPKSLPGGRKRLEIAAVNPDLVPADNGSLGLSIGIPNRAMIALDGDGTSPAFLQFTDGIPLSGLALTYSAPGSTTDDVDFSSDNGQHWDYVPVPGDDASQAAVTNVRLRPRGAMAAGSSFSVSLPLKTK